MRFAIFCFYFRRVYFSYSQRIIQQVAAVQFPAGPRHHPPHGVRNGAVPLRPCPSPCHPPHHHTHTTVVSKGMVLVDPYLGGGYAAPPELQKVGVRWRLEGWAAVSSEICSIIPLGISFAESGTLSPGKWCVLTPCFV